MKEYVMLLSSHRLRFYNVLSGSYVASRAQDVISCTPDRGEREKKNMNNKRIFKALAANRVLPPECEHTIFCNYRGSKGKRPIRTPPAPPFPFPLSLPALTSLTGRRGTDHPRVDVTPP